jgi:hypothetical protein
MIALSNVAWGVKAWGARVDQPSDPDGSRLSIRS